MKKNLKNCKEPSFETACSVLTCLLIFRLQTLRICDFLANFIFNYFLENCCYFWNIRLSSLNFELNVRQNKPNLSCLDVQVLC